MRAARSSAPVLVSVYAMKLVTCCCTRRHSVDCFRAMGAPGPLVDRGAIRWLACDRWLAREAPEMVTSDGLKPRAAQRPGTLC